MQKQSRIGLLLETGELNVRKNVWWLFFIAEWIDLTMGREKLNEHQINRVKLRKTRISRLGKGHCGYQLPKAVSEGG